MAETAFEHSAETTAPASAVWHAYQDVDRWSSWNTAVSAVRLDGPFRAGASGTLHARDAGVMPFRVLDAHESVGYSSETVLTDTVVLVATASLTPLAGGGTRITHRTELKGPAAPYFAASFGPALAAGMPATVAALVRTAEASGTPS